MLTSPEDFEQVFRDYYHFPIIRRPLSALHIFLLIRPYIWTFLWALVVLILCLLPPSDLNSLPTLFEGADKLVHAGFFFIFSVLLFHASIQAHRKPLPKWLISIIVIAISLAFALFTEFLQWKVFVYRSAEIWDLFANCCGIGMGTFAFLLLYRSPKVNSVSEPESRH